jgi:phosphate starvation-inducible PhoH-like protein
MFASISRTFSFSGSQFQRRSSLVMRSSKKSISNDVFLPEKQMCPIYKPRGPNQKMYVHYLNDPGVSVLISTGPAGTGKTLFACATAVQELMDRNVDKIILTRPVVPVEEDIGYLPGSLVSKMHPWTRPIFDILEEFYSLREIDSMIHSGIIEISPLAFMRGRTFKRSFVIADEMQNSSPNQMLMLATRLGEQSRMVITGDLKQSDRCEDNGLLDLLNKLHKNKRSFHEFKTVLFEQCDVERSITVSKILELYSDKPSIAKNSPVDLPENVKHSSFSVFSKHNKE